MYSIILEVWQYMDLNDKRFIIRTFGSFGEWMNANLKQLGVNQND